MAAYYALWVDRLSLGPKKFELLQRTVGRGSKGQVIALELSAWNGANTGQTNVLDS